MPSTNASTTSRPLMPLCSASASRRVMGGAFGSAVTWVLRAMASSVSGLRIVLGDQALVRPVHVVGQQLLAAGRVAGAQGGGNRAVVRDRCLHADAVRKVGQTR